MLNDTITGVKIDILTLFPEMFKGPFDESIVKRAQEKSLVEIAIHDLRQWATDKHKTVDDRPYGGGVGMIIRVDIIHKAITQLKSDNSGSKVILLDAGGKKYTQKTAKKLSKVPHLILIAGHYEGVDYRIHKHIADEVISIGDYVLTGGELPAMVMTDTIVRLVPGVLKKTEATEFESFSSLPTCHQGATELLEYPQFTRPEEYEGWKVPNVLLSGNHHNIKKWRESESMKRTKKTRPDLVKTQSL